MEVSSFIKINIDVKYRGSMEKLVNKALDDLRDRVYGSEYEQFTNLVKGIVHDELAKTFSQGGISKLNVGDRVKERTSPDLPYRKGKITKKDVLPNKNKYTVGGHQYHRSLNDETGDIEEQRTFGGTGRHTADQLKKVKNFAHEY